MKGLEGKCGLLSIIEWSGRLPCLALEDALSTL